MSIPKIRKQIQELSTDDLLRFPVWEFAMDEEGVEGQDEATVRPHHCDGMLDAQGGGQFVVRASYVLADGSRMYGHLTPSRHRTDLGMLHPCIVTAGGQIAFWQGVLTPTHEAIAASYQSLCKTEPTQVFPVRFTSDTPLQGGAITGQILGFMVLKNDGSVAIIT